MDDSDLVAQKEGEESGSYQDVRLHGPVTANCRSLLAAPFFFSTAKKERLSADLAVKPQRQGFSFRQ